MFGNPDILNYTFQQIHLWLKCTFEPGKTKDNCHDTVCVYVMFANRFPLLVINLVVKILASKTRQHSSRTHMFQFHLPPLDVASRGGITTR